MTSKTRSPLLPDVPTAARAACPASRTPAGSASFAPAGTPQDVIAKIQRDTREGAGRTPTSRRSSTCRAWCRSATRRPTSRRRSTRKSKRWAEVVKDRNLGGQLKRSIAMKIDLPAVEEAAKELYIRALKMLPPDIKEGFDRLHASETDATAQARCSARWSRNIAVAEEHRQPALPGHRHPDLQRRRSAAASRSTAHALKQAIAPRLRARDARISAALLGRASAHAQERAHLVRHRRCR